MVAAAKRADLVKASADGFFADGVCVGVLDASVVFNAFEVFFPSVPVGNAPFGAVFHDVAELVFADVDKSFAADAGGNFFEQ